MTARKRRRTYVGYRNGYAVFMCDHEPRESDGLPYDFCIGPWRSEADAEYWLSMPGIPMYNSRTYRRPRPAEHGSASTRTRR